MPLFKGDKSRHSPRMTNDPRLTPLVASLPATVPFVGPEAQERQSGALFKARLGANESIFGPSPAAISAMQSAASDAWKYCDPEAHDLRQALADHHGVSPQNIALGEGIDGLLGLCVRLVIQPGDAAVTSSGAYPTFNYHVAGFGGRIAAVPYVEDHEDPKSLIAKTIETNARLIYFANPDNPMGSWHPAEVVQDMIDSVPQNALLLLDEAYVDLAPAGTSPAIDVTDTRLLRLRTFSKGYGLAGIRVGYAIGAAPLISAFDRIKNHFGLNRIGQAGALAALRDQTYLSGVVQQVASARTRIAQIAQDNGLRPLPSATNFVTIDCGQDGPFARAVLAGLLQRGIFIRMPFVAPQDRCIRVSAGKPADLDAFATALRGALADAKRDKKTGTK